MEIFEELFTSENIKAAITFLFGVGIPATWKAIKWWLTFRRKEWDSITTLKKMNQVGLILKELQEKTGAVKALIIRGENGGQPSLDRPFYSSVHLEAYDHRISTPVKPSWQRQFLDIPYISMLVQVAENGQAINKVSSMSPGILKDVYEATDIKKSHVFRIAATDEAFFYLSVAFASEEKLSPQARDEIRSANNKIRVIFEEVLAKRKKWSLFKKKSL